MVDANSQVAELKRAIAALWREGNAEPHRRAEIYARLIAPLTRLLEHQRASGARLWETLNGRADCYAEIGKFDHALDDLNVLLMANPDNRILLRTIAGVYLKAGRHHEALETIERALQDPGATIFEREVRGQVFRALGRLKEAEEDEAAVARDAEAESAKWDDPDHYYHYK